MSLVGHEPKISRKLKTTYGFVSHFYEGLAKVCKDGKEFHIHPDGQPAYENRFDYVGCFHEGKAWARNGDEYFRIDRNGNCLDELTCGARSNSTPSE